MKFLIEEEEEVIHLMGNCTIDELIEFTEFVKLLYKDYIIDFGGMLFNVNYCKSDC